MKLPSQVSTADSVIQVTGTVEFEDGLWIGNHLKSQSGLQRVRTIPGGSPRGCVCTRVPPGQTVRQNP